MVSLSALRRSVPLLCLILSFTLCAQPGFSQSDHSGTITSDETWPGAGHVHVLQGDVTVNSGVTLTLEPGAIIKVNGRYSLNVNGSLSAEGSPGSPIVFTSYKDDSVGGDSNGDGDTTSPGAGDWWRINLTNSPDTRLTHMRVRYGGYYTNAGNRRGCLYLYYTQFLDVGPAVEDCNISDSYDYGIYLAGTTAIEASLARNTFSNVPSYGVISTSTSQRPIIDSNVMDQSYGIYSASGCTITNNSISNATQYGIYLYSGSGATITGNTFAGETNYALYTNNGAGPTASLSGNGFTGTGAFPLRLHAEDLRRVNSNQFNWPDRRGFQCHGGTLSTTTTWDLDRPVVMTYTTTTVPADVTLTLAPGTIIKFDANTSFTVNRGTLLAEGGPGPSSQIVFTAYEDDDHGGDTNGDGDTTAPARGSWWRIDLTDSPGSRLDHVVSHYGGYYTNAGNRRGMLYLSYGRMLEDPPVIQNSEFAHSSDYTIYLDGGAAIEPSISNNAFHENGNYGIISTSAVQRVTIDGNTFDQPYGIYIASACTVTNNLVSNASEYALYIYSGSDAIVTDNTTEGDTRHAIYMGNYAGPMAEFSSNRYSGIGAFPLRLHPENLRQVGNNNQAGWPDARGYLCYGGSLSTTATWDLVHPVIMDYTTTIVPAGVTLTLTPGTIIKFDATTSLSVTGGTLLSEGGTTPETAIVFTAFEDDEFGGDTNGDGTATSPAKGSWWRIDLTDSPGSRIDRTIVRYGGYYTNASNRRGMVYLNYNAPTGTEPIIQNSELSHSSDYTIYLDGNGATAARISRNSFHDNNNYGVICTSGSQIPSITENTLDQAYGIYIASGATVANNSLSNAAAYAIYIYNGSGAIVSGNTTDGETQHALYSDIYAGPMETFTGNSFAGTGAFPVRLHPENLRQLKNNDLRAWTQPRGLLCYGGTLSTSATWNFSLPVVMDYTTTTVPAEVTLTLAPGSVIKFDATTSFSVTDGTLLAEGGAAESEKIVFTSLEDDGFGGDTNGDSTATAPAKGSWWRLDLINSPGTRLSHVITRYGGYYTNASNRRGMVYLNYSTMIDDAPVIQNSEFSHSSDYTMYLEGSAATEPIINRSSFHDNNNYGVICTSTAQLPTVANSTFDQPYGIYIASAATISNNAISNASEYGLYVYNGSGAIVAGNTTDGDTNYAVHMGIYAGALGAFQGNTFEGTGDFPLRLHAENIRQVGDNDLSGWTDVRGIRCPGGPLATDATWNIRVPIVMDYTTTTVPADITLTLAAGTIIKFDATTSLSATEGTLVAAGGSGATKRVVFTAFEDDEFGGDTNGDGTNTTPTPGSWWRLDLTNSPDSRIENAIVRYGGYYTNASNRRGMVYLNYSSLISTPPVIQRSEFSHSSDYTIYLEGAAATTPTIGSNSFHDNSNYGIISTSTAQLPTIDGNEFDQPYGVYISSGCDVTNNSFFNASEYGIYVYNGTGANIYGNSSSGSTGYAVYTGIYAGSLASLGSNDFGGTGPYPVRIDANNVPLLHNNIFDYPNARGYLVKGGTLAGSATWRPMDHPLALEYTHLTINSGDTLTLDAGLVLKMNKLKVITNGMLATEGTAGEPVVITSIKDDEYGGDTNNDGNLSTPAKGDWYHLTFPGVNSEGLLQGTMIRYGGYYNGYAIGATSNDLSILDCEIQHTVTNGIYLNDSSSEVARTSIHDGVRGVYCVTGSEASFQDCNFTKNSLYGIENADANVTVNATNCWWGHESGPFHATENPGGTGNQVSDHVDFAPWRSLRYSPRPIVVQLKAYQSIVPRGGTYDFKETLVNTSGATETFDHRFRVYDNAGEIFHVFPPRPYSLKAGESLVTLYTLGVPSNVPTGSYMIEAVAFSGSTEHDSDSLYVDIIDLMDDGSGSGRGVPARAGNAQAPVMASTGGDGDVRMAPSQQGNSSATTRQTSPTRHATLLTSGTAAASTADVSDLRDAQTVSLRARWTLRVREATRIQSNGATGAATGRPEAWTEISSEPVTHEAMDQVRQIEQMLARADEEADKELLKANETPGLEGVLDFRLGRAFPNPFNPTVSLPFELSQASRTHLAVYDMAGRRVAVLIDQKLEAGRHVATWRGTDDHGRSLPSGTYVARLVAGEERAQGRLLLVK